MMTLTLADVRHSLCARLLALYYGDYRIVSDLVDFLEELAFMGDGEVLTVPHFDYVTVAVEEHVNGYDEHYMRYEIRGL